MERKKKKRGKEKKGERNTALVTIDPSFGPSEFSAVAAVASPFPLFVSTPPRLSDLGHSSYQGHHNCCTIFVVF